MAYVIGDDCIDCGACIGECHAGAIYEVYGVITIEPSLCTDCDGCTAVCPTNSISKGE